jgi:hypothetical protein
MQGDGVLAKVASGFAFGGGLMFGGLSKEAMALLMPIFSFDYMGASEFEHGAVPNGLHKLAKRLSKNNPISTTTIDVHPDEVVEKPFKGRSDKARDESLSIHVICDKARLEEVADRVRELAIDPSKQKPLEHTGLGMRVCFDNPHTSVIGWLELDNGWLATTDEEMRDKLLKLFGVEG